LAKTSTPAHWAAAAATLALLMPLSTLAQIKIGQTAGFTGQVAAAVKEMTDGAKLYLNAVNAEGGVRGERIELVSLDDKFDPKLAAENAKALIADPKVIALFLNRGTPHAEAIVPLLSAANMVLLAPSTGAMVLHQPLNPWVFNVRTTYQREAEQLMRHLAMGGADRVAIVQVNDSFGDDAAQGALKVCKASGKQPAAHLRFDRITPDFKPVVDALIAAKPNSVLFVGSVTAVADGVKALRAAGSKATLSTLSNNASSGFITRLGPDGTGMVVSQVFPSERTLSVAMVTEALKLAQAQGLSAVTPSMLEGFAAAKVLVAALKRSPPKDLTRSGLRRTLESMNRVDIGGLTLGYSATDHTGLDYTELSIIGPDGKFRR
jgi:branched-chain amino acid transport system substrate-binding protein